MARTLSIELGAHAVKVVSWSASTDDPPEAEVAQVVPQDGELVPSIADRLAALDRVLRARPEWASGGHVVASWPAERATVHRVKLPFDDPERIEQTLPFTLEAEVPFDLDAMVVAWRPSGGPGEVLVTLVRRDEVEPLLDGLADRGLAPRKLFVVGDALAWYADPGLDPDRVTAVVDVGHENTVVSVVRSGRTLSTRAIGLAGRTATRAVQEALGCAWGAAQAIKHGDEEPAAGPGDDEAGPALFDVDDATAPVEEATAPVESTDPAVRRMPPKAQAALDALVAALVAEVRATLVQAEDDLGLGVDEVVLTGGGSRLPELPRRLADDLGLPVRPATTPDGTPVPQVFAVARALGAVAGRSDVPVTDLRVGDLAYKGGLDNLRLVFGYGAAFLGFFLVAAVASFGFQLYRLSTEQAAVEERVRGEVAEVLGEAVPADLESGAVVSLLADMVVEAQTEAEFLGGTTDAPRTVDLLHRLTTAFPPHPEVQVEVETLDISPKAVQIEGTTEGFAQVDRIGESLVAAGGFGRVEATPGNKDGRGRLAFTVSIDREGGAEDTDAGTDEEAAPVEGEEG